MATAKNTAAITFPTPTGAWSDPTHFSMTYATDPNYTTDSVITGALPDNLSTPGTGDTVQFAAEALVITATGGGIVEAQWEWLLNNFFNGSYDWTIRLHTASPTASNELSGNGYAGVVMNGSDDPWTISDADA